MFYVSTRGGGKPVASTRAVLNGIAPDGGLYMPQGVGAFDWKGTLKLTTQEMSERILGWFLPEFPDMAGIVRRAYRGKFDTEEQSTQLDWSVDEGKLPEGDWYWAVFRRGPGQESFIYYMSVPKDERSYIEYTLKAGEEADYYIRLQFEDGRRSSDSDPVHVVASGQ